MGAIGRSRGILACLVVLAAAGMSACSALGTTSSAGHGNSHATAQQPPVLTASPTPSGTGGIQNLVISSALRSELTAIFVASIGIQISDLPGDGPIPGDTYYAYDPATDIYWAWATFPVNGAAPPSVIAAFREHGQSGMFRKAGAGSWQVTTDSAPTFCAELRFFPPAVLTAWALPTTPPPYQTC